MILSIARGGTPLKDTPERLSLVVKNINYETILDGEERSTSQEFSDWKCLKEYKRIGERSQDNYQNI